MPRRLSENTMKMWQSRLQHTERVYREMGILGGGPDTGNSVSRLLMQMYRGNHWGWRDNVWADLSGDELRSVNKIFETVNTILAQTAANDPKTRMFPADPRGVSAELASSIEALINNDIRELRMMRQWNHCLRDHCYFPVGVARHYFTPEDEFFAQRRNKVIRIEPFRAAVPNRPGVKRELLWNVYLPTHVESWLEELPWVAFRCPMTEEQIRLNPHMTLPRGVEPTVGAQLRKRQKNLQDETNPDLEDRYEVFTVYEARERTWFQMFKDGSAAPLRDQDDFPIPWPDLPVNLLMVNEQSDTPFPVSMVEEMLNIQTERNELRTIISHLTKGLRRVVGVDKDRIEEEDLDKWVDGESLSEVVRTNGPPREAMSQLNVGGFPQEVFQYDQQLEVDGREVVGVSKMDVGQRVNVETANEAAQIGRGSAMHEGRREKAFREFMEDTIRTYAAARRLVATEDEVVPVVGSENAALLQRGFAIVSPQDLQAPMRVEIEVGSTTPRNKVAEAQLAAIDLQTAQSMPEFFNVAYYAQRYVEARGHAAARALTPQAQQAANLATADALRSRAQPSDPARPPSPVPIDPTAAMASNRGIQE